MRDVVVVVGVGGMYCCCWGEVSWSSPAGNYGNHRVSLRISIVIYALKEARGMSNTKRVAVRPSYPRDAPLLIEGRCKDGPRNRLNGLVYAA